jgi:hypothetical protein
MVAASGVGAHVDLDAATISGGMLQTMGVGAAIQVTSGNTAAISGAGLAMGAVLDVHAGADLYLSGTVANRGTISVGDANGGASTLPLASSWLQGTVLTSSLAMARRFRAARSRPPVVARLFGRRRQHQRRAHGHQRRDFGDRGADRRLHLRQLHFGQ